MYEQDSSYRKYIVQCSLEYTIRGDVTIVATAIDDVIVKECRIGVRAVVAYVVGVVYTYYNRISEVLLFVVLYYNRGMT